MITDIELTEDLTRRLSKRIDLYRVRELCGVDIVIGGGALLAKSPHDFDLYARTSYEPFDFHAIETRLLDNGWIRLSATANALTYKDPSERIFQFCSYAKKTPESLISSFDFAHCQIGLSVQYGGPEGRSVHTEAIFTQHYIKAMALQNTYFVASEYPMSSLIRVVKYAVDGWYGKGRRYMPDILKILSSVVSRGFRDYDDFKDQLDAIDLNYTNSAKGLWDAVKDKLVPNAANTQSINGTVLNNNDSSMTKLMHEVRTGLLEIILMRDMGNKATKEIAEIADKIESVLKAKKNDVA